MFPLANTKRTVVNMLLHLYSVSTQPAHIKLDPESSRPTQNGYAHVNGHASESARQAREAEEFELHGLTSDDEDEDDAPLVHKESGRAGS